VGRSVTWAVRGVGVWLTTVAGDVAGL